MTERENFFAIARRAGYERMSVFHVKHPGRLCGVRFT